MVKTVYKVGDKVFAKIKGYPAWPAKINRIISNKSYNVIFYGTKEVGNCKAENICYYLKNRQSNVDKYIKRGNYEAAIKEIDSDVKKDGGDGSNPEIEGETAEKIDVPQTSSEKRPTKRKNTSQIEPVPKKAPNRSKRKSSLTTTVTDSNAEIETIVTEPITEQKTTLNEELNAKLQINDVKCETQSDASNLKTDEQHSNYESKKDETEGSGSVETEPEEEKLEKIILTARKEIEKNLEEHPLSTSDNTENLEPTFVPKQLLENIIAYAEHVRNHDDLYKAKPVENRSEDDEHATLLVELPNGNTCGLKLHKKWPLENYENEYERALYDEAVAQKVLEIHNQLVSGKTLPNEIDDVKCILKLNRTAEEIRKTLQTRNFQGKMRRLLKLKTEADLITWNSKLLNSLGLEEAYPDIAIECLKGFSELENKVEKVMFKKHPHIIEAVSRMRKYVGNVNEWQMNDKEKQEFSVKAKQIQIESEKVFGKIKAILNIPYKKGSFWDSFHQMVSDFKDNCKFLSESEICILCEEPNSRLAFFHLLEEKLQVSESENE